MKKEYQTPKMEIVKMPTLGNLLQDSGPPEYLDVIVEDAPEADGGGD